MSVPMRQMNSITILETSLEAILNTVPCTLSAQEYKKCLEQFLEAHPEEIFKVFTWVSNSNPIFKEKSERNDLIEWFYTAIVKYASNKGGRCTMATVATMSFQDAAAFYKKLGYEIDFEREGYTKKSRCLFLKKGL